MNKYIEKAIKEMEKGKGTLEILSTLKGMGLTATDANEQYAEAKDIARNRLFIK